RTPFRSCVVSTSAWFIARHREYYGLRSSATDAVGEPRSWLGLGAGRHRFGVFAGAEAVRQRHSPTIGGPDGVRKHGAQPASLQLIDRGGRRATGRRHHVPKLSGMFLSPLGEGNRSLDRLEHQVMREVAGEAEVHST